MHSVVVPSLLAGSVALNLGLAIMLVVALRDGSRAWGEVRAWRHRHKLAIERIGRLQERGIRVLDLAKTRKWPIPGEPKR